MTRKETIMILTRVTIPPDVVRIRASSTVLEKASKRVNREPLAIWAQRQRGRWERRVWRKREGLESVRKRGYRRR
jgi:hypothetical protein